MVADRAAGNDRSDGERDELVAARPSSDKREWQEVVDLRERTNAQPMLVPECPDWCAMPSGHSYEGRLGSDDRTYCRHHVSGHGAAWVWQEERNREGLVTVRPAMIHIGSTLDDDLDADHALELAAELVQAARLYQRIKGSEPLVVRVVGHAERR